MKVTRIKAGTYKVQLKGTILMVRGGPNYNPDSRFFRNGGFDIWTANSPDECRDDNCWAVGAPSYRRAMEIVKSFYYRNNPE